MAAQSQARATGASCGQRNPDHRVVRLWHDEEKTPPALKAARQHSTQARPVAGSQGANAPETTEGERRSAWSVVVVVGEGDETGFWVLVGGGAGTSVCWVVVMAVAVGGVVGGVAGTTKVFFSVFLVTLALMGWPAPRLVGRAERRGVCLVGAILAGRGVGWVGLVGLGVQRIDADVVC